MILAFIADEEQEFHLARDRVAALGGDQAVRLCLACDACWDYNFYSGVLLDIEAAKCNASTAQRSLQAWNYAKNGDRALNSIENPRWAPTFQRTSFATDKKIVYLDQNVASDARLPDRKAALLQIKAMDLIQFVYSPAHLEETFKMGMQDRQEEFLALLTELTDDATLQPTSDFIELFIESPSYSLKRVEASPEASDMVERNKILKDADRSIFFPKYQTEDHKKSIANQADIFEKLPIDEFRDLIFHTPSSLLSKAHYQNLSSHKDVAHAVYTLHAALDLLGYRVDKGERKLRSSVHDVEHLIYGTRSDVFVTSDEKLAARARQIYSFMGLSVAVKDWPEFLEYAHPT